MDKNDIFWMAILLCVLSLACVCYFGATTPTPVDTPTTPPQYVDFDPRVHPAAIVYTTEDGTPIRGLQMTDETFDFMTCGHDPYEKADMREQVDSAEEQYMRNYVVYTESVDYMVENGIVVGSAPHME